VRRQPLAAGAFVVLALLVLISALPGVFATHDPLAQQVGNRLAPPSPEHFFGTDELGRDIYSRVVHGTGLTLASGFGVVAVATVVGTLLGLVAGYRGGLADSVVMRLSDVFLSFPALVVAMAIVATFGRNLLNAMFALALIWWPQYSRLLRGQVLAVKEMPYIEAARATGVGDIRMMFRHVLPNCLVPILVRASIDFSTAILLTSSLSFLGVGAQPPSPELGAMVAGGRQFLLTHWWYATFPSFMIFISVLALNLVSDGVRDLLDPTLRVA
jgi:peptide/nickel transport system permease protein